MVPEAQGIFYHSYGQFGTEGDAPVAGDAFEVVGKYLVISKRKCAKPAVFQTSFALVTSVFIYPNEEFGL